MIRIVKLKGGMVLYATSLHESGPFNLAPATPSSEGGVAGRSVTQREWVKKEVFQVKLLHLYLKAHWGSFYLLFYYFN